MNNLPSTSISPLAIAGKLAAASNLTDMELAEHLQKEPRLAELLWFLQWASMQPGSLEKWASDIVDEHAPQFGPSFVHEAAALTVEQQMEVWDKLDRAQQERLIPVSSWKEFDGEDQAWQPGYSKARSAAEQRAFRAALVAIAPQTFRDIYIDAAKEHLPALLRALCDERKKWVASSPWYCRRLFSVLLDAVDAHASRQELQLARTELVSIVFEKLEFAWTMKRFIKIDGDARSGKTEAVKAWCSMHPGKVRLVATPPGSCSRDLFQAMAEAFGIYFTPEISTRKLKDLVEFVLRHGGLMIVMDEAHFLLPPPASSVSTPARLDWFRTQAVDRKRPVALVTTPQAFKRAVEKFQRHTGYNFDQLFGRIDLNVSLPNELGSQDLTEVVRIHGGDFPEPAQRFIALRIARAESYLSKIEAICCLARYIAQRAGHAVTVEDVEQAASEVLGTRPAPSMPAPPPAQPQVCRKPAQTSVPSMPAPAQRGLAVNRSRAIAPAPSLATARQITLTPEVLQTH
jgi:hypothetical protein